MALTAGAHGSAASASSASLATSGLNTTVGSGVVVGVTFQTSTFTSITDSLGNAAPIQIGAELGATQKVRLYYFPKLTSAGVGHTFTCNTSGANLLSIYAQEVLTSTGLGILLDQQNGGDDAASPFGDALGITTTLLNEFLVSIAHWAAGGTTNPDTWTAGASFTMTENQTAVATTISGALGWLAAPTTGSYNASWTATQATTARMHLASFSEVMSSGPTLWAGGFV